MFGLGPQEMLMLAILGVLLFGKKLPEVGRSLGKSIVEFKNGLRGIEDDIHNSIRESESTAPQQQQPIRPPQRVPTTAPKFTDNPDAAS